MSICSSKRSLKVLLYIPILLIGVCSLFTTSCNSKKNKGGSIVYSDGTAEYNKIINRATELHDSGHIAQALFYIDSASRQMPPKNTIDIFHYYYFHFDYYNCHSGVRNSEKAQLYGDSMIYILKKDGPGEKYMRQYAQALFSKGDALFMDHNYAGAYKYFYDAKTIIKDNVDPCALADYSYRLGMVLYKQNKYLEAAYYFEESFAEFDHCDLDFAIFYRRQELLDNIGLSFAKAGVHDSAMTYYNAALTYIHDNYKKFPTKPKTFEEKAKAVIYGNMAEVYSCTGNADKAIELLNNSIAINEKEGFDNIDAQLNRLRLAKIYYGLNNTAALQHILEEVQNTNDVLPDKNVSLGLYDIMWKYHKRQGNVDSAFTYLLQYHNLRDSIDQQMKLLLGTDMNERVKNMDKQYQISILEKNNDLKKTYLIIALLCAVLSGIIFLLILYNWQKSKANVGALTSLHEQVSTQKVKLELLLGKLEETNRDKDRVLRAVAHDIRNPIAAISSLADLLAAEEYTYDAEQAELLMYIKNSSTDALSLTKEILEAADPSKAEALVKENVDIKRLLTENIVLLRFKAAEKQQQINVALPDKEVHAIVNKDKIWRVVSNLVNNAIKFSPPETVIELVLEQTKDQVLIHVHDKGIGIPESIQDKIFDMFTDAKRPGTSGEKPFGLGLSISRQIVEAHNGSIWFETNAHDGATFHVSIPIAHTHDA